MTSRKSWAASSSLSHSFPSPVIRGRVGWGRATLTPHPRRLIPNVNDYARNLRNNATEAERVLWHRLKRRQLNGFKFRRQRAIGPYIADFVCLEAGLVIELDGSQHLAQATYDERRDVFLKENGFRVLRFWNGSVFSEIDSVVETIFEALHRDEMEGRFD